MMILQLMTGRWWNENLRKKHIKATMIIEKLLLGFALAAPIGPVNLEMIKRGLKQGFREAFKVRLGGATGNTICLIASYLSLSTLLNKPIIIGTIGLIGAVYLIIIGLKNLRQCSVKLHFASDEVVSKIENNSLLTGVILSMINPISIVFWLSIFASTYEATRVKWINFTEDLFIIVGVLIWGAVFSLVLSLGKSYLGEKNILSITKLAGVLLIFLGLKYTWLNLTKIFFQGTLALKNSLELKLTEAYTITIKNK